MKVYILVHSWPYEGYDQPEGVFSKEEDAREYCLKKERRKKMPPDWEILEYEVDNTKVPGKYL